MDILPDEAFHDMMLQVGMTPLMLACRLGHESMVDMMVSVFGAEIDPADKVGSEKMLSSSQSLHPLSPPGGNVRSLPQ